MNELNELGDLIRPALPALAEETRAQFAQKSGRSDTDVLRGIIADNQLVIGIYPDRTEPLGFDYCLIKGCAILESVLQTGESSEVSIAVIPCTERDEALAMCTVFGDDSDDEGDDDE